MFTLVGYFVRHLFFSLPGALYALLGLVFWTLFFDPRLGPPEIGYYILMNGTFGVLVSFLVTLTIAGYANRAMHYPLLVRLHSRVEYLTAVLIGALALPLYIRSLWPSCQRFNTLTSNLRSSRPFSTHWSSGFPLIS